MTLPFPPATMTTPPPQTDIFEPYVQPFFVSVIDVVLLGLITVTGTAGNLLIFVTILTEKKLQNQSNALVLNIAFADILIMAFIFPVVIGNVIVNDSVLSYGGCVFASCLVIVTAAVSIGSMAAIAANRYVFICRNHEYERYFSKRNTAIIISAMWIFWIGFMCVSGIWLPHEYNHDSLICIFNHQNNLFFTGFLMGFGIGFPACITFVCYYKIYKKVSETQNALKQHEKSHRASVTTEKDRRAQIRKRRENRATFALFIAFICFLVFWGPYGAAAVVYHFQRLPQYTIKYLSWIGMSNSCVNSFVYGAMNKTYRDGYLRILTCGRSTKLVGQDPKIEKTRSVKNDKNGNNGREMRVLSVTSL